MDYCLEKIYEVAGKFDKVTTISFKAGTEGHTTYGPNITVVFLYTQYEREELDQRIENKSPGSTGYIKAKGLLSEISDEKKLELATKGINTSDIQSLFYFGNREINTFHSPTTRTINKIEIPIHIKPKGRDIDWMFGMAEKYVKDGIGLSPRERAFYIACKFYYCPEEMAEEEMDEVINENGGLNELFEWEYLMIKERREEITPEGKKRLLLLYKQKKADDVALIDHFLKESGSSLFKLGSEDIDLLTELYIKAHYYQERRLNVVGKKAIYLDKERYLHIFMRHVKELKVNNHFDGKDNFQWEEKDVLVVLKNIVRMINDEVQLYFEKRPGKRFSKYGRQSLYFEGDYYTIHIEAGGKISTFHKNRKRHEQPVDGVR
jgi:hypothetical protein